MAYADQDGMSTNRLVSIIIVVLLHAFLGYALVTGLAYDAVIAIKEKMTVVDVKEEKPKEEEPPPPEPEQQIEPPPITAPQPPFQAPTNNPVQARPTEEKPDFTQKADPVDTSVGCWDGSRAANTSLCPQKPVDKSQGAKARGNPGNWANTNDYPSRALQQEREGTTGFRVTIGPNGRVTDCQITSSSGHPDLDQATCSNVTRRARFDPALDNNGNPTTGTYSNRVRWQIPK
ncbi:energy transducer TonB [Sphingorhabdus sp. IMCC26285]|uniref:Energy transducer TonB n=1 Tax=Sphingorhabdus profundilacus TaxID=2509718 RepID=A0A6I4M0J4_9SPHN|nr:energy transducer TonB [Sphingorhabdus profundilacus]MVZ97744.1 energy transducer TonB [Sphingorhabdus profundilacus]